jgi:hypothetical protein
MWSEDTSGVQRKKPPESFNTDLNNFAAAADWVTKFIHKRFGLQVRRVLHDAYPDLWRFYDSDGEVIVNIEHDLMRRLALVLEQIEWLEATGGVWTAEDEEKAIFGEEEED